VRLVVLLLLGVLTSLLNAGKVGSAVAAERQVHGLGHSLVAGAHGLRVANITLFIFGGVSSIAKEASTARAEFLIAVIGPLISLGLALVLGPQPGRTT
jgi:Zn-dependent protease